MRKRAEKAPARERSLPVRMCGKRSGICGKSKGIIAERSGGFQKNAERNALFGNGKQFRCDRIRRILLHLAENGKRSIVRNQARG